MDTAPSLNPQPLPIHRPVPRRQVLFVKPSPPEMVFVQVSCKCQVSVRPDTCMTEFFEGFTAKPDIIIDDMPSTCVTPFVYDVRQEQSWDALAERIIDKHID